MSAVSASPAALGSAPADPVRALQHALYRAAKADPGRRFHALRDKVYRRDVLWRAWVAVRRNDGAPGIDKTHLGRGRAVTTLAEVEQYGVARLLGGHRQVVDLVWWLRGLVVVAIAARYKGYGYPIEVIGHAVWLYHRFALSRRDVEELMLARGVVVTYETIRSWCAKFGPDDAAQ